MNAMKLAKHQQRQLAANACTAYCQKYRKKDIPDLVIHVLDRIAEANGLKDLDTTVEKIHEMVEKFEKAEKNPNVMEKEMRNAVAKRDAGQIAPEIEFKKKDT